jgi:hypothetical protein
MMRTTGWLAGAKRKKKKRKGHATHTCPRAKRHFCLLHLCLAFFFLLVINKKLWFRLKVTNYIVRRREKKEQQKEKTREWGKNVKVKE